MAALAAARTVFGASAYSSNLEDLTVARDAMVAIDAVSGGTITRFAPAAFGTLVVTTSRGTMVIFR